jgi:DNA integrity scanning protein DisA with diadenylate cyclase activity
MADTDDSLEILNRVVNEIEAHTARLVREAKLNRATPQSLMQEVSETVMPLLKDFSVRMFAEVLSVRQYIHQHVEPALMRINDDTDSVLMPDDAEMITQRLMSYRELLEGMIPRATGDDKAKMEAEMEALDTTLARVAEITAEDDPDDVDPDGDEPEVDDDEGGEEDEGPNADPN